MTEKIKNAFNEQLNNMYQTEMIDTDAEIKVESQNDNAKVTVDSETQDTNQVTIKRKIDRQTKEK